MDNCPQWGGDSCVYPRCDCPRKARTVLEMLTSGDVEITHPGPNWGVQLNSVLTDDDFNTLMDFVIDTHAGDGWPQVTYK